MVFFKLWIKNPQFQTLDKTVELYSQTLDKKKFGWEKIIA